MKLKIITTIVFLLSFFINFSLKAQAASCYVIAEHNSCQYTITVSGSCNGETTFATKTACIASKPNCDVVSCGDIEDLFTPNESCTCDANHPRFRWIPATCWKNGVLSSKEVMVCFDKTSYLNEDDVYGTIDDTNSGINNKDLSGLGNFINKIINFILFLAAVLLFVNIILAGIQIITNGKDPKGFSEAMKKILFSVIGILIAAFAYIIADYVMKLFFGNQTEIFGNTSIQLKTKDHWG